MTDKKQTYEKFSLHLLISGYMMLSMIGTKIRIKMGLTVWWRNSEVTLLKLILNVQHGKVMINTRALPAFAQAGLWELPVEETDRQKLIQKTCLFVVLRCELTRKSGWWEFWNQTLTKLPSMTVAWRVHREPCKEAQLRFSLLITATNSQSRAESGLLPAGRTEPRTWAVGCRGTAP